MEVVGLYLVRDEVDVLELNLRHHLGRVIDRAVVVDNGSADGTPELLRRLAGELPVRWTSEPGPYRQEVLTTELAREAHRDGADWVLPIDADEFWVGERDELRDTAAGVLRAPVRNFVQHRDVLVRAPEALLSMTRRVEHPVPTSESRALVEAGEIGLVEMGYPEKCLSRPTDEVVVRAGNHHVLGAAEEVDWLAGTWYCLHAPLRAREVLQQKADTGARIADGGFRPDEAWHTLRWWQLSQAGGLEEEWAANSWDEHGLRVGGRSRPLLVDTLLADLLAPLLPPAAPARGGLRGWLSRRTR